MPDWPRTQPRSLPVAAQGLFWLSCWLRCGNAASRESWKSQKATFPRFPQRLETRTKRGFPHFPSDGGCGYDKGQSSRTAKIARSLQILAQNRFSRTRSSRELKALTIQPRRWRRHTIMARILSEQSQLARHTTELLPRTGHQRRISNDLRIGAFLMTLDSSLNLTREIRRSMMPTV